MLSNYRKCMGKSDKLLFGMVWYGMVWYGMVWYGMVTLFIHGISLRYIYIQA